MSLGAVPKVSCLTLAFMLWLAWLLAHPSSFPLVFVKVALDGIVGSGHWTSSLNPSLSTAILWLDCSDRRSLKFCNAVCMASGEACTDKFSAEVTWWHSYAPGAVSFPDLWSHSSDFVSLIIFTSYCGSNMDATNKLRCIFTRLYSLEQIFPSILTHQNNNSHITLTSPPTQRSKSIM